MRAGFSKAMRAVNDICSIQAIGRLQNATSVFGTLQSIDEAVNWPDSTRSVANQTRTALDKFREGNDTLTEHSSERITTSQHQNIVQPGSKLAGV